MQQCCEIVPPVNGVKGLCPDFLSGNNSFCVPTCNNGWTLDVAAEFTQCNDGNLVVAICDLDTTQQASSGSSGYAPYIFIYFIIIYENNQLLY